MINLDSAKKAFDKYVSNYDMNDPLISLKYSHTYRVCKESLNIAKSINLDLENTYLAVLIAMLHDIGRFEQARIYQSFNDSKTVDHADLGVKILFEDGLIREFISDNRYDEIIKKAIEYHNKYEIGKCNELELLHSKIIRDADKLDIINNVVNIGAINFRSDASQISEGVILNFKNEKSINAKNKKTHNDSLMTMLAFPFDLNFDYSYHKYEQQGYIDKMYEMIEHKEIFSDYVDELNEYIKRKCKYVR